uniref:Cytochrome P450 n=1 Tax=Nocardiopsis sp. CMB-M0232 TaxID=1231934 RepID=A0A0R7QTR7_9ACTN|nr:cytochrome P450 [Nocardiopsis sp. CMB-M0232]
MPPDETPPRFPFSHRGDALGPEYRDLQEHRPIARVLTPTGERAWLVTDHTLAVRAFEDDRLSLVRAAAPGSPRQTVQAMPADAIASMSAIEHAGLRKEFLAAISPPRVVEMRPWARTTARAMLDSLAAADRPADLFRHYAEALPLAHTCRVLGMPFDDAAPLIERVETAMPIRERPAVDYAANWAGLHGYFLSLLARADLPDGAVRRYRENNDARPPEQRVDDHVLAETLAWFFGASHIGAVSVLAHTLVSLLAQRDAWDRLCELRAAPGPAVEELLRHSLFLHNGLPRVATDDVDLGGVTIGAGELVLISADTANRDPAAFPGPDRIDLDRDTRGHLAFGRGANYCPGSALGRMTLQVAIEELTRRFPTMYLAVPLGEIEWRDDLLDRRPVAIPVRW